MKKLKKWAAVAGAGLAVLMLTVAALPASAAGTVAAPLEHRGGGLGGGVNDTYLAEALGITAAELQTAEQTAHEAAIDQALAQGLITQAQADALKENSGGRGLKGLLRFAGADGIDTDALLADALNITTDELDTARVEAQDLALAAAVEDGRITQEQADQLKAEQSLRAYMDEQGVQDQVKTLYETLVKQAVQAGVITQAQADTILSNLNSSGKLGGMRGLGGFGGHGRGGMRGFDAPNGTAPSTTTPSRFFQGGGATLGTSL